MYKCAIIHFGEIGLKRENKSYFVEKLILNINKKLRENVKIYYSLSRIIIENYSDEKKLKSVLNKISGIKYFTFNFVVSNDLEILKKSILTELQNSKIIYGSFRIRAKRSQIFKFSSVEIEKNIGAFIKENTLMNVNLKNPELTVFIEFFNDKAFFTFEKNQGIGGMSANSGNKLISLISSGFDSPVASFKMIKRGARVIFVHFHSLPYSDMVQVENVKSIVGVLSQYQISTKLYLIPFYEIQKSISSNLDIDPKYRVILYKRIMIKIAEIIAYKTKALGLITGDNFAQVASQTSKNLYAIHECSKYPIYQPLIGYDKDEIIKISNEIDLYRFSSIKCNDTCSMFSPVHPEINASVKIVKELEEKINTDELIEFSLKNKEIIFF